MPGEPTEAPQEIDGPAQESVVLAILERTEPMAIPAIHEQIHELQRTIDPISDARITDAIAELQLVGVVTVSAAGVLPSPALRRLDLLGLFQV